MYFFLKPVKLFLLLTSLLIINCESFKSKDKYNSNFPIELHVSPEIQSKISLFHKTNFNESETEDLFFKIREESEEICLMAFNKKPYNHTKVSKFINMYGVKVGEKGPIYNLLPRVIAGCWNYFRMNDIHPEKEFQLVESLYPQIKKECFSVGYMQPYIMNSILNCSTLNMLDIDWRIHFTHFNLINSIRNKNEKKELLETKIENITYDWVAFHSPLKKDTKLSIKEICSKDPNTCMEGLVFFDKFHSNLKAINLQISPLYDITFKSDPNSIPVIYTSNALDNVYTKMHELKKMLSKLHNSLYEGQKALILYHNGGLSLFGIYEITKSGEKQIIKTICRDTYHVGGMPDDEKTSINLDKLSSNDKYAISCSSLYRKTISQEKK